MLGLLYAVGAVALVIGAALVGIGIPNNEFSVGSTLILAGVTTAVGGLIVIGLGVVVAQLQRLADVLATRAPVRSSRPLDVFEPRNAQAAGRVPFPAKPKSDVGMREPHPVEQRHVPPMSADQQLEEAMAQSFAPTLHNPEETPVTVEDEVSLSPQHPVATPAPVTADVGETAPHASPNTSPNASPLGFNGAGSGFGMPELRHEPKYDLKHDLKPEPKLDADWRPAQASPVQLRLPQTSYFDAMWPADAKPAKAPATHEPKLDMAPPAPAMHREPEASAPHSEDEARTVAILKSGVVDGMGYTLYVDGSIEADLPQGTLRFASINELRSHLENNA